MTHSEPLWALIVAAAASFAALIALTADDEDEPVSPAVVADLTSVQPAPPEYRGAAAARILFLEPEFVHPVCTEAGAASAPGRFVAACVVGEITVMPDPCAYPEDTYAKLMCHEKAHLLGWRH